MSVFGVILNDLRVPAFRGFGTDPVLNFGRSECREVAEGKGISLSGQPERWRLSWLEPFAEEFLQRAGPGALREKIGKCVAQRCGGDEFGGGDPRANSTQPGAEG